MTLAPIPTLDQLAADPTKAASLPVDATEKLLAQVHVVEGVLLARLLSTRVQRDGQPEAPPEGDHFLTPEEAAKILGVTVPWLYRHAARLPFTRRLSRKCLRFSEAAVRKWQAAKRA